MTSTELFTSLLETVCSLDDNFYTFVSHHVAKDEGEVFEWINTSRACRCLKKTLSKLALLNAKCHKIDFGGKQRAAQGHDCQQKKSMLSPNKIIEQKRMLVTFWSTCITEYIETHGDSVAGNKLKENMGSKVYCIPNCSCRWTHPDGFHQPPPCPPISYSPC